MRKWASIFWKALNSYGFRTLLVVVFALFAWPFLPSLTNPPTTIDDIGVPRLFADNGLSASVAAEQLRDDADIVFADAAKATIAKGGLGPAGSDQSNVGTGALIPKEDVDHQRPDFVVPVIGLSTETITSVFAILRHAHHFSGYFRMLPKGRLSLTLREDDEAIGAPLIGRQDDPDALLQIGAKEMLERHHASIVVASLYGSDDRAAIAEADAMIKKLPSEDVEAVRVRTERGLMLSARNDNDKAKEDFLAAIAGDTNYAPAHYGLGGVLKAENNGDGAEAQYKLAIKLDPRFADPLDALGLLRFDQHRFAEALSCIEKAIDLDPKNASYYNNLGFVLYNLSRNLDAIKAFDKSISLDPRFALAHTDLATVYMAENNHREAISQLRAAIAIQDTFAPHVNLANIFLNDKNYDSAVVEYNASIDLLTKDKVGQVKLGNVVFALQYLGLGNAYFNEGRYKDAGHAFAIAATLSPSNVDALNGLGVALARQGKLGDAEFALRKATTINDSVALVHYNLARVLFTERLAAAGKTECDRAASLDSSLIPCPKFLAVGH